MESQVGIADVRLSETNADGDDSLDDGFNEGTAALGEVIANSGDSWPNFDSETGVE